MESDREEGESTEERREWLESEGEERESTEERKEWLESEGEEGESTEERRELMEGDCEVREREKYLPRLFAPKRFSRIFRVFMFVCTP